MDNVKWVKIFTSTLVNPKINYIRRQKNGDTMALLWVLMLVIAGNYNGDLYLADGVPYDVASLADLCKVKETIVERALNLFAELGMIEILNGVVITISSWEEYQSTDKLQEIRDHKLARQQRWREKKRQQAAQKTTPEAANSDDVSGADVDVKPSTTDVYRDVCGDVSVDALEERRENKTLFSNPLSSESVLPHTLARNYNMQVEDVDALLSMMSARTLAHYVAVIERCESLGMRYKRSRYQAILGMYEEDKKRAKPSKETSVPKYSNFDVEDAFQRALERTYGKGVSDGAKVSQPQG